MSHGPRRAALDRAIESADPAGIDQGATAWRQLAVRLTVIARGLEGAQQVDLRGRTGDSMRASFARATEGLQRKSETLQEGQKALDDSREAVERAARDRAAMDSDPALQLGSDPGTFTPDPDRTDAENRTEQGMHAGRVAAYWDTYHRREAESQRIADQLDADLTRSGERMRGIHGEPDPITVTPGTGGVGGGDSAGAGPATYGGGRAPYVGTGPHASLAPAASTPQGSGAQGAGDAAPPGAGAGAAAGSSGTPPGTAASEGADPVQGGAATGGGLAGGAAGGLAAGVAGGLGARGLAGALRGGPSTAGQPVRGQAARPLGSTSRAAVSGALGRGGAAPAAGSTSRAGASGRGPGASRAAVAGQPSAARAGSRGGLGRGGQGGQGGQGGGQGSRGVAGAVGAGRGRGARDDATDGTARDLFDHGQDWVDDGDAARGVLD